MQGKQILVIDDDPHVLRMVRLILSNEGAKIHTAASGMEGIAKYYAHRPDLVGLMAEGRQGFQAAHIVVDHIGVGRVGIR